jgi:phenylpyruvate tautomerase PptA (4-oxalocrotonate tautomerase family)
MISERAKLAQEITRIHTSVMKVPASYVRVVFISYPKGSGFTAGEEKPVAVLNCILRSGHSAREKTDLLEQLWSIFQAHSGAATDEIAICLKEIQSNNAMEMRTIMRSVGHQ